MVASILPEDETCVSPKELENKRLNVVITNLLYSCVCRELKNLILKSKEISKDAHLIRKLLFEIVHTKWDDVESDDEDEPVEICSTTSTTSTNNQASILKQGEHPLGLVQRLPKLNYQKDLVCAPCRHDKMVIASHPPLTSVMTERPCELFHMDLVGPVRVCSTGGKWYVLVIVDDFLSMLGSSFWLTRGRRLVL
jgi:hypothetical protein